MTEKTTYASLQMTEEDHNAYEMAIKKFVSGYHHPMLASYDECRMYDKSTLPTNLYDRSVLNDFDPAATSFLVSRFHIANQKHVDEAVDLAIWEMPRVKKLGWEGRLDILRRARLLIEDMKHYIAAVLTLEVGKTRSEAIAEVCEVMAMIDAYEKFVREENFYRRLLSDGSEKPYERTLDTMEPTGVVPVIVPFNFPFALCANMSMAAFLAGNPVIIKPSEDAPLASFFWRNIFVEAGASPGAVSFLPGHGEVGRMLVEHPSREIGRIAFTGSRAVGVEINIACALLGRKGVNRKVIAELGSKNPVIVTRHADLAKAASGIMRSATGFSGQKCSATSRVYVEKSVRDELIARMTDPKFLAPFKVGDPRERSTWTGPLINKEAYERYNSIVMELRERSKSEPILATALCSEESANEDYMQELQEHGYYVAPLLVTGIDHNDHLAREEHFVPFVTIHEVESLQEAVAKAKDTQYGLCAGLFSEHPDEQNYFEENINFGVTYINRALGATSGSWPTIQSFGGWGMSGLGGLNAFGPWYPLLFAREQCRTRVLK